MSTLLTHAEPAAELERLRAQMEAIDRELMERVAARADLARRIGAAKRCAGLPMLDPAREAVVVRRARGLAREMRLEPEIAGAIFWHLIDLCRRVQREPSAGGGAR